ncbi:unnamed protein product [Periconia digitata]|uniref:Uncharacterized protein n=1 Tax=Periconia digitata TaxID=1303443 RepID=A0A9W4UP02_9PLEO|nr:unnamed protein product [Periconia digitata]
MCLELCNSGCIRDLATTNHQAHRNAALIAIIFNSRTIMASLWPRRLRDKIWPEPLPPLGSFNGKTVLVTGATAGLGLAAAIHFVRFGAVVIITSRSKEQGQTAKNTIETLTGTIGQGKVHIMQLDMNTYRSCVDFVEELKKSKVCRAGLDVAVLNAGLINIDFQKSPQGWEQTIQINTLSTTLLGLLLLDWMTIGERSDALARHLVFVTSRDHLLPDISNWEGYSVDGGILEHFNNESHWPQGSLDPNYCESKLMVTYAIEKMCEKVAKADGGVPVIVNKVCPGLVYSDIGRSISKISWTMKLFVAFYLSTLGKSTDYGSRLYLSAARTLPHEHGKFLVSLYTDDEYEKLAEPNLKSETALRVRELVWGEILDELKAHVPSLREIRYL